MAAGAIAFLCSPVPLLDEAGLAALYGAAAYRLGRGRGLRSGEMPWSAITATIGEALVLRAAVALPFAWVPVGSEVVGTATAVALTPALVGYFDEAMEDPEQARPADQAMLRAELERLRRRFEALRARVRWA